MYIKERLTIHMKTRKNDVLHGQPEHDDEKCAEITKKINDLHSLKDIYQGIMSRAARIAVGNPPTNIELRENWKIVSLPKRKNIGLHLAGVGIVDENGVSFFDLNSGKIFN